MTMFVPEFLPVDEYTFARLRRVLEFAPIREGVYDVGDLKVTQRAAGANKSVDIAAGRAWVRGDDTARQGSYHCENDGTVNLAIADNTSGNPRIDQVIVHVYDSSVIGGGTNAAPLEILQGTPTAGATIDNRLGAAALPATAIRLADIPVASGFASITSGIIRDRRAMALGLFASPDPVTSNANPTATDLVLVPEMTVTAEFSGAPVRVHFDGTFELLNGATTGTVGLRRDGADFGDGSRQETASRHDVGILKVDTPPPGRHTYEIMYTASVANGYRATGTRRALTVEEILRPRVV